MPEGMPARALIYHYFAEAFGFTERQVDEDISLDMLDWYMKISQAKNRAGEMKQKQAQRESQQPRSRHF